MRTGSDSPATYGAASSKIGRGWAVGGLLLAGVAAASPILLAKLATFGDIPNAEALQAASEAAVAAKGDEVLAGANALPSAPSVESVAPPVVEVPLVDTAPADVIVSSVDRAVTGVRSPDTGRVLPAPQTGVPAPRGVARNLPQPTAPLAQVETSSGALYGPGSSLADLGSALRGSGPDTAPLATAPSADLAQADTSAPTPALPVEPSAEMAEAALQMDSAEQRRVQLSLRVLGYDPQGVDGVFGPNTREAIAKWQAAQGMEATGYLEAEQRDDLIAAGAPIIAERARQRRAAQQRVAALVVDNPREPAARNAPECARDQRGTVIENQSFSCDLTVLRESLSILFGGRS